MTRLFEHLGESSVAKGNPKERMDALVHTRHGGTESNFAHASYVCRLIPCLSWRTDLSATRTRNMCTPHPKLSFVVTRLFQQRQSRYDYACQSVATPCRRRIWNAVDGHGSALPFQFLCAGSTGKAGSSWNSVPCSTKALEEHSLRYDVLCRCGRNYHWKYRFRPWQNRSSFDAKYPC